MVLKDYSRIAEAVDVNKLHNTHIFCIGTGGAYGFCESLCRSGVGKISLIDFDVVEESNLVRQGYTPADIGMLKVEALKSHLAKINSKTEVVPYPKSLQEVYEAQKEIFEDADLLLFLTDSFEAQAFGNKIALEFQKPAIWAGYYERSHCAELVFYIPEVTPACFRCAVSPRYKMQEKETIVVSSNSNMVFHSQLLDSYIGMLAMAILHNETEGYEYSKWFGEYWDRSLIQFKVHPEYEAKEGDYFHRVFKSTGGRAVNFNSIWQSIERELPPKYETCPDCGHLH